MASGPILFGFLLVLSGTRTHAAEPAVTFADTIQPLLAAKCISCHGPESQEGNLRLDSRAAALQGGDRGPALVAGKSEASLLVRAVTFADPDLQMPPRQKLSDPEIAALARWVDAGAAWPAPVAVLFEDDPQFLAALTSGNGRGRLVTDGVHAGQAALGITPLQRDAVRVPGWNYVIRENPQPGEFRYLRLAWKKRGAGSVMIELAANGAWPDAKVPRGRYVAGPNTTGWAALPVSETAPSEWTVVTFDLARDLGPMTLTGIAPTCDGGDEAFFDSIVLGPTLESLDAYRPGTGSLGSTSDVSIGDAFTDARNPIRRIFRGERLDLWSLRRPAPPEDPETDSIDAFLRQRRDEAGIPASPEADRRTLIRRLTFDLTGLPPTPREVAEFLADPAPDAYERLIERLLESPRYGERQARFWLDVVRYADTNGYERDEFRPRMWQYRDYVIRAFNADKPFDRFIHEQLAGDELIQGTPETPADADALIATGYLRLGQWDSTAAIFQEEPRLRAEMMADLTNTTASAFLGLTMSCCQCHDHKYDPLSQADHFRLRAFFAAVTPRDDLPVSLKADQEEIDRHNAAIQAQIEPLQAELKGLDKSASERQEQLKQQIHALERQQREPRRAMAAVDAGPVAPATQILYQGDWNSPRDEVPPGFPSVFSPGPAPLQPPRADTTGRRLALARWITAPENPWTARVLVNRVWQQHFGEGLVATPNDFGYSGARPTHPELLDWLALQFQQEGWSLKSLHRRIVLSAAYRQSSAETESGRTRDPSNQLQWRQNPRRLDAETLRDSLLAVAGLLKDYAGKPVWPAVPEELLNAQPAILEAEKGGDGGRMQGWYTDPVDEADVRSIFLIRKRCLPIPFLQAFDLPDSTVSCARRDTTVVAPQALMLLNSPEGIRAARALAERIVPADLPLKYDDLDRTRRLANQLVQTTLQRDVTDEEWRLILPFLRHHTELHETAGNDAERLAFVDLCRTLLNLNEFLYLD